MNGMPSATRERIGYAIPTRRSSVDLGLAALYEARATVAPSHQLTLREIADVCECSWQAIDQIEKRALMRIRNSAALFRLKKELQA